MVLSFSNPFYLLVLATLASCFLSTNLSASQAPDSHCVNDVKSFFSGINTDYVSEDRSDTKDELAFEKVVTYLREGLPGHEAECASEVIYRGIDIANLLPSRAALLDELYELSLTYPLEAPGNSAEALYVLSRATLALNRGDLNRAKHLSDLALSTFKPDEIRHVASAYIIHGYAHEGLNENELALSDFIKSYEYYSKLDVCVSEQISALNAIALVQQKLGNSKAAISYIEQMGRTMNKKKQQEDVCSDSYTVYLTLAKTKFSLGKLAEAHEAGTKAMELATQMDCEMCIARTNMVLGELAFYNGDYTEAEVYLKNAASGLNLQGDARFKAETFSFLSEIYKSRGDHDVAFTLQEKYLEISDSIKRADHEYEMRELQQQVENERMKQELIRAEANTLLLEEKQVRSKLAMYLAFAVLAALACVLAVIYTKYREKARVGKVLEQEVQTRTHELEMQKRLLQEQAVQLKQSNQELERFAYVASHDLKTPVRNISSFLGLIKRRIDPDNLERVQEYFDIVGDSCTQMDQLITDVLEFSKIDNNDESKLDTLDLRNLADKVRQQFAFYVKEKNATIEVTGGAEIRSHSTLVGQVIKNLIENGLKYNTSEYPMVKLEIKKSGNEAQIIVQDNGIGIAKENHAAIFEMFKRLHGNSVYKGTGVGLAVCAKIAAKLGGRIDVESEQGRGSKFTLSLPVINPQGSISIEPMNNTNFKESSLN